MSGTQQSQPDRKRAGIPPTEKQAGQETWEGGGREPIHPDDIGDDGEYPGKTEMKQQLRSDDN